MIDKEVRVRKFIYSQIIIVNERPKCIGESPIYLFFLIIKKILRFNVKKITITIYKIKIMLYDVYVK